MTACNHEIGSHLPKLHPVIHYNLNDISVHLSSKIISPSLRNAFHINFLHVASCRTLIFKYQIDPIALVPPGHVSQTLNSFPLFKHHSCSHSITDSVNHRIQGTGPTWTVVIRCADDGGA